MLSFFRRKKPQDAPAAEAPKTQHYSAEELAAAFPSAAPVEDKEPAPVAVPAAPAPVEPPPVAVVPVAVEPTPVVPAPVVPAPSAPQPAARIDVAPVADPAIEPAPAPLPEPTPAPVTDDLPAAASVDAVPAPAGKPGWRERLRNSVIARSFGGLFSRNPKLDDDLLDELETALITADVGVGATTDLVEGLRKRMKSREFADANALLAALRAELIAILQPVAKPLVIDRNAKPFVVLTVGVNGVGKTTTIGKLAKRFKDDGHSLMLAAGDTFRAAAVAQLQAWGERNGVAVVAQGQNADAASVAFDALQAGKARGTSVLIADTAGRLHTQSGLMNELGKIRRVLGKIDPTAPHEVLMVIDGTTGQNALSQLRQFNAAVNVTGLVVTKLDGTAKGGVVFALAREFGIPIRFAGIGERPEDLRVFDPEAFVDALLPEALGA
ncbi:MULTISPECIES: signal recognition particle-docking protein FtsY [Stenotrophomonas]|uniref:signal recognition particle-docking protein FtsY n=1 Tax=Stenotrophomonas TaxID=40323 RepID=UPI00130F8BB2|nr:MULTISPECIES: signal recognition particle-docking protein FtsY [Stenotrophomonas]MBH1462482.1 signal recognition particle-docking protein FtsY [Stenotrophomonas maltophilia]MDH0187705.1 signal recognition particle-docking protein FtsY [Stenotrophomonas sp. GD04051]MDH0463237.1 signal recognition particle-docking protein FtsY [Stenotrophomonas sp. GD03993]MDH0876106.1 signal recognition particle-docking protein FtsY [Stenotrophomonas sp. GD03877]MDH2157590.1 signal recognition particle-docki